ncbi:PD-(D/E)XK nuclease family protein [Rhizobium sp. MHM7A]|uniref:PDDEXK-like family protein n=1 Tax=Rhizobium sp. MHM7A TaxID=2583233 RepID=UPI0011074695|nr:PD-(D/E)XK nuclease family protein [Rhizobium sp. MHM7A]TLX16681.1 hypothetical protein FFR93_04885 [Rhizobium sp. MHM7A]
MTAKTDFQPISDFITDFSKMLPRLAAMREGVDLYGATTFSPFAIFDPDENTLSRVIAELFDPAASHGQGLLFLNALLTAIGIPRINSLDAVKVRREASTRTKRRIDVVIETSAYVIGIENKPWAIQQKDQLKDYREELRADLRGRKPILIFISDQDAATAAEDTIKVPYYAATNGETTFHALLSKVVEDIKATAPKAFVEDFLRYIETTFGGVYVDSPADKLYTDAVNAEYDSPHRRKAIASVLLAQDTLHYRILDEIGDYLLDQVRKNVSPDFEAASDNAEVDPLISECLWVRWTPYGLRRPTWPVNCHVAIEASANRYLDIIFGVKAPDGTAKNTVEKHYACPARKILENMAKDIAGGKNSVWWTWYKSFPEKNLALQNCARLILESPTGDVKDHPEIQDLASQFVVLAKAVNDLLEAD